MRLPVDLPQEFTQALFAFDQFYSDLSVKSYSSLSQDIWMESGNIGLFKGGFKVGAIPTDDGWMWNQSKRKKRIQLKENNVVIEMSKLVPRRKKHSHIDKLPKYKIWIFKVIPPFCTIDNPDIVIWCERGKDVIDTLSLEDFTFLAEFMSPKEAKLLFGDIVL